MKFLIFLLAVNMYAASVPESLGSDNLCKVFTELSEKEVKPEAKKYFLEKKELFCKRKEK